MAGPYEQAEIPGQAEQVGQTGQIDLDLAFEDTDKIDLSSQHITLPLPAEIAERRALKANYGLGGLSPGKDNITTGLLSGSEKTLREESVQTVQAMNAGDRIRLIKHISDRADRTLSPAEEQVIIGLAQEQNLDPETIWEKMFAEAYMTNVVTSWINQEDDSSALSFQKNVPYLADVSSVTSKVIGTMEYFRSLKENLQAQRATEGTLSTAWQYVKTAIPLYNEYQLWNADLPGWSYGSQLRAEVRYVWSLPPEKRKEYVNQRVQDIYSRNPLIAEEYLDAMISFSSSQEFMGNFFTAMNLLVFAPTGKAAKTAAKAIPEVPFKGGPLDKLDEAGRKINIVPRSMTIREVMKANEGLGIPPVSRNLTPEEVVKLKDLFPEQGPVTGFKTRLNEYEIRPDGTTVKDKTPRTDPRAPGETVLQPAGARTVYIDPDWVPALQGMHPGAPVRYVEKPDGTLRVSSRVNDRWQLDQRNIAFQTEPRIGLVPLELWRPGHSMGSKFYNRHQFGDPITELIRRPGQIDDPRFLTIHEIENFRGTFPKHSLTPDEVAKVNSSLRGTIEALSRPTTRMGDILESNGRIAEAAALQAAHDVAETVAGTAVRSEQADLAQSLRTRAVSLFQPVQFVSSVGSLSREAAQRLTHHLSGNATKALTAISTVARAQRLTEPALQAAFDSSEAAIRARFAHDHGTSAVLDVIRHRGDFNWSNTHSLTVRLGNVLGQPFDTKNQAVNAKMSVYKLGKDGAEVVEVNGKYVLDITKPLDETLSATRELLVVTGNRTPVTWSNFWLGKLRGADAKLSQENLEQRQLVQHAKAAMNSYIQHLADDLSTRGLSKTGLSKDEHFALERVFSKLRTEQKWYSSVSEFQADFRTLIGRSPSERETMAYGSYVQLNDFNYVTLNLGFYRDLSRQGIEHVKFRIVRPETETEPRKVVTTNFIYGKEVSELPRLDRSYGIAYIQDSGAILRKHTSEMTKNDWDVMNQALQDGARIIQVANPIERPLSDYFGTNIVNFVLTKDFQTKKLDWGLIPYKPGGHKEFATQHFVKMPVFSYAGGKRIFEGDVTTLGFETKAEAVKYSGLLNKAMDLFEAGKMPELRVFLDKNLPAEFSFSRFTKNFNPGADGAPPKWQKGQRFLHVQAGRSSIQEDKTLLARMQASDETASPYNLFNNVNKRYLGERDMTDLYTIKERGTEQNPQVSLASARLIDPFLTLNRSVSSGIHALLVNDYRQFSIDSWTQEFWTTLRIGDRAANKEVIERNPLYYILEGNFDEGMSDGKLLAAAKHSRRAIIDFLGMDTPEIAMVKTFQDNLLSGVYEKFGQKKSDFVARSLLPLEKDPATYARQVAFDLKLGLFNPIQLPLQAMTSLHAVLLAGAKNGYAGAAGATLANLLRMTENPKIIRHFAEKFASKAGWKPDEFIEALEQGKRSGWFNVQGETAWRNDVTDPKLISTLAGRFLDAGRMFFKEGERISRTTGWFTAFKEWKIANPGKRFSDRDMAQVIKRADLMNVNMTRASAAEWQQGLASVPTQFLSYPVRLMEQMLSGRITHAERARLTLGYGALFGVPAGVGSYVGVWPVYESIRSYALENKIDLNSPFWKFAMDGIPITLFGMATGTDYNFVQRFSPGQGVSPIREYMTGTKELDELLVGAAGGALKDVAGALFGPPITKLSSMLFGAEPYPLKIDDAINLARPVASLNQAIKAVYAWNWGVHLSKREDIVADDLTKTDALFAALGLTRTDITDAWRMGLSQKTLKDAQKNAEKEAVTQIRKAIRAAANNDEASANEYMLRARWWITSGNFLPDQEAKIFSFARRDMGSYINRIRHDFNWGHPPLDRFKKNIELNRERN